MKKTGIYIVIGTLIISLSPVNPITAYAEGEVQKDKPNQNIIPLTEDSSDINPLDEPIEFEEEKVILFAEKSDGEIDFFEQIPQQGEEATLTIPDETEVILLISEHDNIDNSAYDEYSSIQYTYIDEETNEEVTIEGYVHIDHPISKEDAASYKMERERQEDEEENQTNEDDEIEDNSKDEGSSNNNASEDVSENDDNEKNDIHTNEDEIKVEDEAEVDNEEIESENEDEITHEQLSPHTFAVSLLKKGVRDPKVTLLKKNLEKLGFKVPGNGTNYFGLETEKKVKEFQKYYGLSQTGTINNATNEKINKGINSPFQNGKRHNDTLQLKRNLNKIGFGGITVTTLFSDYTEKRVREFQKHYGLKVTGIADEVTLAKITELSNSTLKKGMRHKDVITLKKNLAKIGFTVPGKGTNLFGIQTEMKVKEFQKYYGLKVTGIVDVKTQSKINSIINNPLQNGKRHNDTLQLKRDLNKIGFGGIKVTTLFSDYTEKRVREFQKYYSLKVTGVADEITMSKLKSIANSPLQKGKRHKDTIKLKMDLANIGYTVPGNGTNLYGAQTEKQVKKLQKDHKLKVNGIADEVTLAKIKELSNATLKKGMRHKDVITLKKNLAKIGFRVPGNGTNLFGVQTEKKVKEFQKYYGISQTGTVNNATKQKINKVINSPFQNGKRHNDTLQLKRDLNKIGFGGITVTTLFSDYTEKRVRDFQKHYGLKVNGIADEVTLKKIAEIVKKEDSKPPKPSSKTEYTNYKLTLNQALDIQMKQDIIQTDKHKNKPAYVSANYLRLTGSAKVSGSIVNIRTAPDTSKNNIALQLAGGTPITITGTKNGTNVSGSTVWYEFKQSGNSYYIHSSLASGAQAEVTNNVNVRSGKGASNHSYGLLKKGEKVNIITQGPSWHQIEYKTWRNPTRSDVKDYLDPSKNDKFQHLRLDSRVGVSASELNKVLKGKGILAGQGQAFINGAKKHGVNEAYLIAHSFLETGNGTSSLAKGVKYKGKTVYNMFGIGAVDSNPLNGGAKTAYDNGWFTPAKAIEGGAKWIGKGYIYNEHKQNTLYKMKWNPRMSEGYAWKQYASDIAWSTKQVSQIKNIYNQLKNPSYHFDIAKYK